MWSQSREVLLYVCVINEATVGHAPIHAGIFFKSGQAEQNGAVASPQVALGEGSTCGLCNGMPAMNINYDSATHKQTFDNNNIIQLFKFNFIEHIT